jgi:hypothetical protein
VVIDRVGLAEFLRRRRESLQPEDVGLPRGLRRRTTGLRREESEEFRTLWEQHRVGLRFNNTKRFVHPDVGLLDLACQPLLDPDQSHCLMVYTAVPGSESYERLQSLSAVTVP